MDDVPRTHKTIDGLSWEGLSVGEELWRQLDQDRELYYGRFEWDDAGGWADAGQITLSSHQHGQERNRRKSSSGDLIDDRQSFVLDDIGFTARFESDEMHWGKFSYGLELHLESLSSFGSDFNNTSMLNRFYTQGPLAADASYNRHASYLQYAYELESGWKVQPGIRYSSIHADLKEFYTENKDFSTQSAPHSKTYDEVIGSVRVSKNLNEQLFVFGGFSQGFRPPSLYDLTSTDETSIIEEPNLNLKSEDFIQLEVGARNNAGPLSLSASYYHTWIRDMIVRSPYLDAASGKTKSIKSNGDGYIHGLELELGYEWSEAWSSKLSFSWMDGEVQQFLDDNLTGTVTIEERNFLLVDRATTRLMPIQTHITTRYQPPTSPWMGELSILAVSKADKLSLKDETDKSRIPRGGTPAYFLFGLRGTYQFRDKLNLSVAIENISDIDYRIHGSGVNGPGRNFIFSLTKSF
jgi:hemoglobin/transferrin/lactoferrin receptor protein